MDASDAIAHARAHMVVATGNTSRACSRAEARGELVRVYRNLLVNAHFLECEDRWEFHRRVNLVRAIAVCLLHPGVVISHGTALDLHGIPGLQAGVDIHVLVRSNWRRSREPALLPVIRTQRHLAPAATVVRHRADAPLATVEELGVPVTTVEFAAVQCALTCPAREAVVLVSGALRRLCGFDRFEIESSRAKEQIWRQRLELLLGELPTRRNRARARAVLQVADAACESVPERLLLWILTAGGLTGLVSQMRIDCPGQRFFVDFGLPGLGLVIEFDGKDKYGRERMTILGSLSARDARQKRIEAAGWQVVRFEYEELEDPEAVVREVASRARGRLRLRPIRALAA